MDEELVEALRRDYTHAPISKQDRVMLDYVVKLTKDATKCSREDHERLREVGFDEINVTSFKGRVHLGVAGPNWRICGEAASMVDPITSNGVTAALRHAAEATALILKYRTRGGVPRRASVCYSSRILQMGKFFNSGIEKVVYESPVRNCIGLPKAGKVYTGPAWSMNVVYARLKAFRNIFNAAAQPHSGHP